LETKKPTIRRRRRKRGSGRKYFTQVHEDAILKYVATDDIAIRTSLYVNYIGPAFDEMVDKIVYTYKFNNLPNIDFLKDEIKLSYNSLNCKDLEILARYSIDNIKFIDIEDISIDLYDISVLKFAIRRRIQKEL